MMNFEFPWEKYNRFKKENEALKNQVKMNLFYISQLEYDLAMSRKKWNDLNKKFENRRSDNGDRRQPFPDISKF